MPIIDDYSQQLFKTLPILILTAKVIKGNRDKCLDVGADDYLPKPIDPERLFSMLRVWSYQ